MRDKQRNLAVAVQALRDRGATDDELWALIRATRAAFQQGSGLGGGEITEALLGVIRVDDPETVRLREHIRDAHRSLSDSVLDGPLDGRLDSAPMDLLIAIHTANHMVPWIAHLPDDWRVT